jgi:uncharacterized protein (TIGR02284 family)
MNEQRDALAALYTTLVDSRNGYQEAAKDAGPDGLVSLFKSMIALHQSAIVELEPLVRQTGAEPDADGSFMSTVHRTVVSLHSMLTGLDETVLPGFIDGETRILERYDAAIRVCTGAKLAVLERQRAAVAERIAEMQRRRQKAA